jgi:hypothetical protein
MEDADLWAQVMGGAAAGTTDAGDSAGGESLAQLGHASGSGLGGGLQGSSGARGSGGDGDASGMGAAGGAGIEHVRSDSFSSPVTTHGGCWTCLGIQPCSFVHD